MNSAADTSWAAGREPLQKRLIWRSRSITTALAVNSSTSRITSIPSTSTFSITPHWAEGRTSSGDLATGWSRISAESNSSSPIQFNPQAKTVQLFSGFAQDEITLVKERLRLILGVKLEHNYLSGFEAQPSVRLSWTPSRRQTAWAAVSRAVRTPARSQQDIRVNFQAFPGPGGMPIIVAVFGSTNPNSEVLHAYELGYRAQPHRKLSLDVATFYNVYDRLTSLSLACHFSRPTHCRRIW